MSNIPFVRKQLIDVIETLWAKGDRKTADKIEVLLPYLVRAKYTPRKAPVTSAKFTAKLANDVRVMKIRNPDLSNQALGTMFNLNHGRVSEALAFEK